MVYGYFLEINMAKFRPNFAQREGFNRETNLEIVVANELLGQFRKLHLFVIKI